MTGFPNFWLAEPSLASSAQGSEPMALTVNPTSLNLLHWTGWGVEVRIGVVWIIVGTLVVLVVWWLLHGLNNKWKYNYKIKAIKIGFGGVEFEIRPDMETRRIAYQAWVEIKSRKAGLPFEPGFDVIAEVYNSWYQLFGVLRELAKSIPADKLKDSENSRNLVALLIKSLNEGLRPHLTKWQAKFRRWYEAELANDVNNGKSPQEIQLLYPEYDKLVEDLLKVNKEFVEFANCLDGIVRDRKG